MYRPWLEAFFARLRSGEFAGGNVTIPHKEAVFALCDSVDPLARTIGAVNTLVVDKGRVHGNNTDYRAFWAISMPWRPAGRGAGYAIVLGAGGAARAVLVACAAAGSARIHVLNRTRAKADALVGEIEGPLQPMGSRILPRSPPAGLIVNTTSIGMHGTRFLLSIWAVLPANRSW